MVEAGKRIDCETSRWMPKKAHLNAGGLPGMWTLIFSGTFLDGHWDSRCGQWACLLRLACAGPVQIVRI